MPTLFHSELFPDSSLTHWNIPSKLGLAPNSEATIMPSQPTGLRVSIANENLKAAETSHHGHGAAQSSGLHSLAIWHQTKPTATEFLTS